MIPAQKMNIIFEGIICIAFQRNAKGRFQILTWVVLKTLLVFLKIWEILLSHTVKKSPNFLPSELQPVYCIDNLDPFNTAQFITLVPGAAASFGLYAKASILGSSEVHAILMGVSMRVPQWKWMVYFMEHPIYKWMMTGVTPVT